MFSTSAFTLVFSALELSMVYGSGCWVLSTEPSSNSRRNVVWSPSPVLGGDDVLAHAIVQKAITNRDSDTVAAFQNAYPDLAEATVRLWNSATTRPGTSDLIAAMYLGSLKPAALASLQDYEIAAAAAGTTTAGSWNAY